MGADTFDGKNMAVLNVKIFSTLFIAIFVTAMGAGFVAPLLPIYAHELGAGGFQIGLIFGAFSLTRTLFVPYFGKLSDRKGRKPFITTGLFLYFLVSLFYAANKSVETLILGSRKKINTPDCAVFWFVCKAHPPVHICGYVLMDATQ